MKNLLLGILLSGIILLLAGCGTDEETENFLLTTGPYAVDFTAAPGVVGFITLGQDSPDERQGVDY